MLAVVLSRGYLVIRILLVYAKRSLLQAVAPISVSEGQGKLYRAVRAARLENEGNPQQ